MTKRAVLFRSTSYIGYLGAHVHKQVICSSIYESVIVTLVYNYYTANVGFIQQQEEWHRTTERNGV